MGWERALPENMGLRNSGDFPFQGDDADLERYRVIITLRYHNIRILIHRLVVVRFLDTCGKFDPADQELALLQQIGSNSVQICVRSSLEIISIVHSIVHSSGVRRGLLGAWWFSLYYTFNAALVVFACILVNEKVGSANLSLPESLYVSARPLQAAVDALMLLDNGNRMVEKCAAFLDRMGHVLSSLTLNSSILQSYQPMLPANAVAGATESHTGLIPMPLSTANQNHQSPLGMDLGEFMIESDLDFLNYFALNQPLPNPAPIGMNGA